MNPRPFVDYDAAYQEGAQAAFAAVEAELSRLATRGSPSSPQWPWHAFDRARRSVIPPEQGQP